MAIDPATFLSEFSTTIPDVDDFAVEGADQITAIKQVLLNQFPNFTAEAVTFSSTELNDLDAQLTSGSGTLELTGAVTFTGAITTNGADIDLTTSATDAIVLSASGTNAACQIRSTDVDSGIYFSDNKTLTFVRDGTDYMNIGSNGVRITDQLRFAAQANLIIFEEDGDSSNMNIRGATSGSSGIVFNGNETEIFRGGTKRLRVDSGGIDVIGTGSATEDWTISSDQRLKEHIEPVTGALDAVLRMRGVHFDWISSGKPQVGVIAQEVQQVIPTAVTEGEDGYLTVSTSQITAVLIEAIRELSEKVDGITANSTD